MTGRETEHLRVLIANDRTTGSRSSGALGLARLAQQAPPLTPVLTLV